MLNLYLLCRDLKDKQSVLSGKYSHFIWKINGFLHAPSAGSLPVILRWKEEFAYIYGDVGSNLARNGKLDAQELLQRYGIKSCDGQQMAETVQLLFYAIQTCFNIFIKAVAQELIVSLPRARGMERMSGAELLRGEFARQCGILDYCGEDSFCWPVYEMDNGFDVIIEEIVNSLLPYRTGLSLEEFAGGNNRDYIRQMYEAMIPKELRHALGEYYTPDWLAERTFQEALGFAGEPVDRLRVLDPTCGSGTFLMQGILAKRQAGCGLGDILSSVWGCDINSLAVLMAKTNYLLSVIDLLGNSPEDITLPVYQVDILKLAEDDVWINGGGAAGLAAVCALGQADLVVGNPPWVSWEYLPERVRLESRHLWTDYGLFTAKGRDLSFSKEDISVLVTYAVMDKLLKDGGIIGYVIRQGVFKSAQNGVGFRRFRLRGGKGIQVLRVDDLSQVRAFDNAVTSTALFYARKGGCTHYPVPYFVWSKRTGLGKRSFGAYSGLEEVLGQLEIQEQSAMPVTEGDDTSPWITARADRLAGLGHILGSNPYRARTGVFTGGANGVYWLHIDKRKKGYVQVSNVVGRAKRKVEPVIAEIEPDYVFPLIKGSNVRRWQVAYDTYLLCPHTAQSKMWPVSGEELRDTCPRTYGYLDRFRRELDGRKGFAGWEKSIQEQEFHAVLRVGDYTFSSYKVVWKYIAPEFVCAVVQDVEDPYLGRKVCLPNEKLMFISTDNAQEAYYLCGILSSTPVADCVKGYMNPTSISAYVLDKLNIPVFDPGDARHLEIAAACREGHGQEDIRPYLERIDRAVALIYGISVDGGRYR